MTFVQEAITFACDDDWLVAIITRPQAPRARGVLVVVGGPQYRVGSHRQFALLANHLAAQGTPVMRFDYAGMGDSTGAQKDFEQTEPDLRAAINAFFREVSELREVVIWGLCDAASAALFYAHQEPRVTGLVLLNPWLRTAQGEAQAYLRHYYIKRLFNPALWRKLRRGRLDFRGSAASLVRNLCRAVSLEPAKSEDSQGTGSAATRPKHGHPLPQRMADGLAHFSGRVLLILSGNDLTAREFNDVTRASKRWRSLLKAPSITRYEMPVADHTFSRRGWRDQVAVKTTEWLALW